MNSNISENIEKGKALQEAPQLIEICKLSLEEEDDTPINQVGAKKFVILLLAFLKVIVVLK